MTGTRVTRDGAMMPIKTCGGCGGPVAGDAVVSIKSAEHQAMLSIHRVRARLVNSWTVLCNQIRGLLTEFGFVFTGGAASTAALVRSRGTQRAYCGFQGCKACDICYTAKIIQVDQVILANYDKIS